MDSALSRFVGANLPHAIDAARCAVRGAGVQDEDLVHEAAHVGVTEAFGARVGRELEWSAPIAVRTIAHRRAIDLLRRRRARARREQALADRDTCDVGPGPRDQAEVAEVRSRVREAIEALSPEEQRWVAALVAHEGPTAAAQALDMPKSSYRSRIERVCDALRRRLRPLVTTSVVLLVGAGALSPLLHESRGTFALRAERPATSALLVELRAEAAHYRAEASSARDVETRRSRSSWHESLVVHSHGAVVSTV